MGRKKNKGSTRKQANTAAEKELNHCPELELACLVVTACDNDNYEVVEEFIKLQNEVDGASTINERDSKGITAIFFAVWKQKLAAVKTLVALGADANIADCLGFTPLFWATGRYPNKEVTEFLIAEASASVTAHTLTGATALHGAALQGNLDCIKLLLKHGADPRQSDEDGTFPLDLAKDDATKALLHKSLRHVDSSVEKQESTCFQCGKHPDAGLKRCGRCHVTLYCSRECQTQHWKDGGHKKNCAGFVVAMVQPFATAFNGQKMAGKRQVTMYNRTKTDIAKAAGFLAKKQFVVKVQVPIGDFGSMMLDMMVYNEDRSVMGMIAGDAAGYIDIRRRIAQEGQMGVKAFFWAELSDKPDESFKVFHGKCAPPQMW